MCVSALWGAIGVRVCLWVYVRVVVFDSMYFVFGCLCVCLICFVFEYAYLFVFGFLSVCRLVWFRFVRTLDYVL